MRFLSTPSARRATSQTCTSSACSLNFYPRPPRGGRPPASATTAPQSRFLSTPSSRRATRPETLDKAYERFLSTPSARRATSPCMPTWIFKAYFYPRPPRGGRLKLNPIIPQKGGFLSTPSARRATGSASARPAISCNFYPRPPRGGRLESSTTPTAPSKFLSTPSARRATFFALIAGGLRRFLSTPSARRATHRKLAPRQLCGISIHALREEGDALAYATDIKHKQFLSTPSARRATAKTETKSLFSNKLYNILHEFRRALIYNGSKSYPNHAK